MLSPTPLKNGDLALGTGTQALHHRSLSGLGETLMSRISVLASAIAISLISAGPLASCAFAQIPPAGSAGAGNSAISGIPAGPANPSVLYDPSGIGNAGRMAPL